jgi:hypothetical protein
MAKTLIATATASSSASLAFTSGIDSTYAEYEFVFYDIHPATHSASFTWQVNAAGATGFNETFTAPAYKAVNTASDWDGFLAYDAGLASVCSTDYTVIGQGIGNDADQSGVGRLHLFLPSDSTKVKCWWSVWDESGESSSTGHEYARGVYLGGTINTSNDDAIDEISFKFSSGNIDAGTIKMYGVL